MHDALVVGGGPAGAALASLLARAGRDVVLVERTAGPTDKVCGEFLSGEVEGQLASLGIDLAALGALSITTLRVCQGRRVGVVELPFRAASLSRRVLDEALLEQAANMGARVLRGTKVRELVQVGSRWRARLEDGPTVEAAAAFLATGKHDLHGHKRPRGLHGDLIAFKLHLHLAARAMLALEGRVELVLFDGGYAGLSLVEGGRANLCLVIRRRRLDALEHSWERVLAAMRAESEILDARLLGARPCWSRPLALSAIPYGHVQAHADGLWRLGDQAVVIPSFCGDGIAIALHSARLAATTHLEGGSADAYQSLLAHDLKARVLLATALSHGLVRRASQRTLGWTLRWWPGLLATIAEHTRIRTAALARTTAMQRG